MSGLPVRDLLGQPLAISLAVFNLSVVGIQLVLGVVGVRRVLSVVDEVDGIMRRSEVFLVECGGYEAGDAAPVTFWLREHGTCADGCTLSMVLLSAVPALMGTDVRCPQCERVRVLLVWF